MFNLIYVTEFVEPCAQDSFRSQIFIVVNLSIVIYFGIIFIV
jgi:hypothetical protein